MAKRILKWAGAVLGLALAVGGAYLWSQVRAFDRSVAKVYDVPLVELRRAEDPAALARGKHLAESMGECIVCHGADMAGGKEEPLGPLGTIIVPNATSGGRLASYSDAELARLIRHGIKRDGTTVRLMPSQNTAWWPDEDVAAVMGWLRAQPPKSGDPGRVELKAFAKLLDRFDSIPIDVARRIDHAKVHQPPAPAPTAEYGAFVATSCRGCHGVTLAGGPIPGAPPDLAVPLNLTAHESGLKTWSYEDFTRLMREGKRASGKPLDAFMPIDAFKNLDEVEMRALWAYLRSVPARPFGDR